MNSLIERLAEVAVCASQKIISLSHLRGDVEMKSDLTPVTEVDKAVSRFLEIALPNVLDAPVISEELSLAPYAVRQRWQAYWLVDPLDGTKDFIAQKPGVAVNLALMLNHRPVLGVVAGPFVDAVYAGWLPEFSHFIGDPVGTGAFKKQLRASDWLPISSRLPSAALRLYQSRAHGTAQDLELLKDVEIGETFNLGSALKMCRIAEGEADVYVRSGPASEWDTAAAEAILLAAGGSLVDWTGKPLTYNKENPLNPSFVAMSKGLSMSGGKITKR